MSKENDMPGIEDWHVPPEMEYSVTQHNGQQPMAGLLATVERHLSNHSEFTGSEHRLKLESKEPGYVGTIIEIASRNTPPDLADVRWLSVHGLLRLVGHYRHYTHDDEVIVEMSPPIGPSTRIDVTRYNSSTPRKTVLYAAGADSITCPDGSSKMVDLAVDPLLAAMNTATKILQSAAPIVDSGDRQPYPEAPSSRVAGREAMDVAQHLHAVIDPIVGDELFAPDHDGRAIVRDIGLNPEPSDDWSVTRLVAGATHGIGGMNLMMHTQLEVGQYGLWMIFVMAPSGENREMWPKGLRVIVNVACDSATRQPQVATTSYNTGRSATPVKLPYSTRFEVHEAVIRRFPIDDREA